MEKRRSRSRGPIGAILFCLALVVLAGTFANDWYQTHFPRVAIAKVEPPPPPAEPAPVAVVAKEKVKTPEEPAPADEENAPEVAESKPPGDDPWAAEKGRLQNKRGRNGGFVVVKPRIIVNGDAFAFNDMNVFRPQIVVPQFRAPAVPQMIDPEKLSEEFFADVTARRVAVAAQATILSAIPEARHFVANFDVAPRDGHLVVAVRDAFLSFNDAQRRTIMEGIAEVWRDSKYTRQGCSKKVEFRSNDGWKETLEP